MGRLNDGSKSGFAHGNRSVKHSVSRDSSGMSSAVSDDERGVRNMTFATLPGIADAPGMTVSSIQLRFRL